MIQNTLALEGGGTRGIMQAVIIAALEERNGKPAHELFDLIGGTSVGAIVGGCLAAGVPAADVIKFFTDKAPWIFSGGRWLFPRLWSSAKYDPQRLRAALAEVVGNRTLADCKTRFIATAFEMHTGRNVYFQSYGLTESNANEIVIGPDTGRLLVDVMLASSAAQSYFPGHPWGPHLFYDGGNTGFNAPDLLVAREMEAISPACWNTFQMLSLGNGNTPWGYMGASANPGIAKVAEITLDIAYAGPESAMVWLTRQQLGHRYYRVDPVIANHAIDDARHETLTSMRIAAIAALHDNPFIVPTFKR